ncbi:hypothetical protein BBP40_004588 [Aspergillus hancockii]|nr:hypothetical protein BBP40_004588 [Aspergillus hancockii]
MSILSLSALLPWYLCDLRASLPFVLLGVLFMVALKRRYATPVRDIPEEIIKLHRKHGHFVRIADNEVNVAHPDAVRLLLQANIAKGSWCSIFSLPDYHYVNQMSELDPQVHIQKIPQCPFKHHQIRTLRRHPSNPLKDQFDKLIITSQPVDLDRWFNYFAFDVVGEVTFSSPFRFLETGTGVRNAIANTHTLTLYIAIMGHYVWLHNLTLGNPLLSRIGLQPSSHIFDTSVANIGAGADTTSATLQAFFYYLVRHPRHLRKLQRKIDEAQARGDLSDVVSYAEAAKWPYLQACSLRVVSPSMGGNSRKGPLGLSPETRFFRFDCDDFNPERWLDPDRAKQMDPFLIHWGAGYNQCPGRNLAHFEISKATATIARDYEIEQVDPEKSWRFETHFTPVLYDWPCWLRRRETVSV